MSIEEIIDRLEFAAKYIEGKQGELFLLGALDVKAIRAAIAELKARPEAQSKEPQGDGWIAIKDRLPEPLEDVLVFYPFAHGGEPKVDMGFVYHTGDWVYGRAYGQPTHWRPLPEPPKPPEEA